MLINLSKASPGERWGSNEHREAGINKIIALNGDQRTTSGTGVSDVKQGQQWKTPNGDRGSREVFAKTNKLGKRIEGPTIR